MAKLTNSFILDSLMTFAAFNFIAVAVVGGILYGTGMVDRGKAEKILALVNDRGVLVPDEEYQKYKKYLAEKEKEKAGTQEVKKTYSSRNQLFEAQIKELERRETNIERLEKKLEKIKEENRKILADMSAIKADMNKTIAENRETIREFTREQLSKEEEQILKRFANMEPADVARSLIGINADPAAFVPPEDPVERNKLLDYMIRYLSEMNARNAAAVQAELNPILIKALNQRKVERLEELKLKR